MKQKQHEGQLRYFIYVLNVLIAWIMMIFMFYTAYFCV